MGKRSRKERRQHQQALQPPPPPPTETMDNNTDLTAASPEEAANRLLKRLEALAPEDIDSELGPLALSACELLRQSFDYAAASQLASAAKRFSHEMRKQELLACFALGRDEVVREICAQDPLVEQSFRPLLAWLDETEVPLAAPKAPSTTKAFHAAFRLACNAKRGKFDKKSRPSVASIDESAQEEFGWSELSAACDLLSPGSKRPVDAAYYLSTIEQVTRSEELQGALAIALSKKKLLNESILERNSISLSRAAIQWGELSEIVAEEPESQAKVTRLLLEKGYEAFEEKDRANAALHQAFLQLQDNPLEALACLDKAVELGADLHEVLRGRIAISFTPSGSVQMGPHLKTSLCAARDLERLLTLEGAGASFRVAALRLIAIAYNRAGQGSSSLETIQRAIVTMKQAALVDLAARVDLTFLEAMALQENSPQTALSRLQSVFENLREREDAWTLRIDLERRIGNAGKADDLTLRAGELKISPFLERLALGVRRAKGLVTLQAGTTTAGELAQEYEAKLTHPSAAKKSALEIFGDPEMKACRAALGHDEQAAYDAACVLTASDQEAQGLMALVAELLLDGDSGLEAKRTVLAACLHYCSDNLDEFSKILPELSAELIVHGLRGLHAISEDDPARDVLAEVASRLSKSQVEAVQRAKRNPKAANDEMIDRLRRAQVLLAPFFEFRDLEESPSYDLDCALEDLPEGKELATRAGGGLRVGPISLNKPFDDARMVLGVHPQADFTSIEKAYRRLSVAHPADKEPEVFGKMREAYELLCQPVESADKILRQPIALAPLPQLPQMLQEDSNRLLEQLLRRIIGSVPSASFSCDK